MREAAEWLDRRALADYITARVDELPRLQKRLLLPTPSYHLGPKSPRWRRSEVDALFAGRTPEVAKRTADETFDRIAEKILRKRRHS